MADQPHDPPDQAEEPTPRARFFQFPGGVFELQASGDEPEDYGGFYLQFQDFYALDGHDDRGAVMRYKPTCLGY
ncbi:hypothetical protein NSK11_contig00255-0005, partial [Nocardia seriolae]